ncbi:MAG: hypothetical protein HY901_06315 [Deltaproteobacteria bacterium]|nr:hypothetical protein [Deltaproteobacteria bacterium]
MLKAPSPATDRCRFHDIGRSTSTRLARPRYFTVPAVSPRTMWRWKAKTSSGIGKLAVTVAARPPEHAPLLLCPGGAPHSAPEDLRLQTSLLAWRAGATGGRRPECVSK